MVNILRPDQGTVPYVYILVLYPIESSSYTYKNTNNEGTNEGRQTRPAKVVLVPLPADLPHGNKR